MKLKIKHLSLSFQILYLDMNASQNPLFSDSRFPLNLHQEWF